MCNNKFIILLLNVFFMLIASQLQADTVNKEYVLKQQNKVVLDDLSAQKISLLVSDSESASTKRDFKTANKKIDEAISLKTLNPWLTYRIANILNQLDRKADADRFIEQFLVNSKPSSDRHFAAALYLAKQNKLFEALAEMDKIDPDQRSPGIIESQQRIWLDYRFSLVDNLIKHDKQQAIVQLNAIESKVGDKPSLLIKLAKYWLEMNDFEHSRKIVASLKNHDGKWPLNTQLAYDQLIAKLKDPGKLPDAEKTIDLASASVKQQTQHRSPKMSQAKHAIDQGNKKTMDVQDVHRKSSKKLYLIDSVVDKIENKASLQNNGIEKNVVNSANATDAVSVFPTDNTEPYASFLDQVNKKAIDVQDARPEPLNNGYLINPVFDKIENKTIVQNTVPEETNLNDTLKNNADALPVSAAPSAAYTPVSGYVSVIVLLLTLAGIGLAIKKTRHFLVKIAAKSIRKPNALKIVDFSHFFGGLSEEII